MKNLFIILLFSVSYFAIYLRGSNINASVNSIHRNISNNKVNTLHNNPPEAIEKNQHVHERYCSGCFAERDTYNFEVKRDIRRMLYFYRTSWDTKTINDITTILVFFNNNEEFKIDYKLMLALFGHESNMRLKATSNVNNDGSFDYGLGQHNSSYYHNRFVKAKRVEEKYNILKKRRITLNKYDPATNTIATAIFLNNIRSQIVNRKGKFTRYHLLTSYNVGVSGMFRGNRNDKYHKEIIKNLNMVK